MLAEALLIKYVIGLLAASVTVGVAVYVVAKYWEHIISWFQGHKEKITDHNLPFTIKEKMASGDCAFVQGIFNTQTNTVGEVRHIKSQEVDDEFRKVHSEKTLAIYS